MSRTIKIIECRSCGKELLRKEEGNMLNPNGTVGVNTEIYKVDKRFCDDCDPRRKKAVRNEQRND